jgi:hypothetical protein
MSFPFFILFPKKKKRLEYHKPFFMLEAKKLKSRATTNPSSIKLSKKLEMPNSCLYFKQMEMAKF